MESKTLREVSDTQVSLLCLNRRGRRRGKFSVPRPGLLKTPTFGSGRRRSPDEFVSGRTYTYMFGYGSSGPSYAPGFTRRCTPVSDHCLRREGSYGGVDGSVRVVPSRGPRGLLCGRVCTSSRACTTRVPGVPRSPTLTPKTRDSGPATVLGSLRTGEVLG